MNLMSRTITGIVMVVLGAILIGLGAVTHWVTLFYGVPLLIIGLFILFNTREDKIEGRKDLKGNKVSNQTRKTPLKGGKK
jgi:sulfite exporter TauE/SafE